MWVNNMPIPQKRFLAEKKFAFFPTLMKKKIENQGYYHLIMMNINYIDDEKIIYFEEKNNFFHTIVATQVQRIKFCEIFSSSIVKRNPCHLQ